MAHIGHRCSCGHGDLNHLVSATGKRACKSNPCLRRCKRADQPELLPTFDTKGRTVERIVRPGDKLGADGELNVTTCGCDACRALYTELTGIELEPAA